MGDGVLEPWQDVRSLRDVFFRQEAVHLIAEPDFDAAVPQPANAHVDFTPVDALKLQGEIHRYDCPSPEPQPQKEKFSPRGAYFVNIKIRPAALA